MNYQLRGKYPTDESCLTAILEDRGVEDVEKYLNPTQKNELNPYDLDNIREGAEMLLRHLRKGSKCLFVIDSDCDGFTSSSILWLYCKDFFPQADFHFTIHEGKKHGLEDKIDWIESQDFNLIIVPDAGSYNKEEMERIVAMGIEVCAFDHHEKLLDDDGTIHMIAPTPHAVIVNNQLSDKYINKSLCGAGVVYKLCQVLDDILGIERATYYLDLVALGEISDVMFQGTNETRYYITKGLKNIHNEGFKALIEAQSFSLKDKAIPPYEGLTSTDIAFYIGPLINAVTRMGSIQENECMFYAFTEPTRVLPSTKRGAKIGDTELAAQQLARIAGNIRQRQNKAIDRAMDLLDYRIHKEDLLNNNIIYIEVFPEDKIPQSITGLLCQRFVSKYNRPCLIGRRNSEDVLQGSMRGNANFMAIPNLKAFLEDSGYFEYVAGHLNAAGNGIKASNLSSFIQYANTALDRTAFENCYLVDYIFNAFDPNLAIVGFIIAGREDCFGNGIDEVRIVVKDIPLASIMVMGANKDSIKISCNGIDYVKFKDADFIQQIQEDRLRTLTIVGTLNLNEWQGRESLQVFIKDYELSESYDESKYDF